MRRQRAIDVLVIGGGPAGLAAAGRLATAGAGTVEVLERAEQAGGVPRHCHHRGFGRWGVTGPQYADRLVESALGAGAAVRTGVSATGWAGALVVDTTGPHGLERITARAVVLATGARERPRAARLVPGTRPAGVYTTGELQQAVHLHHQRIGTRAVVVGAAPVSYAALTALRRAGVEVAALVTEETRPQVGRARAASARLGRRVPLLTGATVVELLGRGRLSAVRLRHADGRLGAIACDTVVFTGDFVPEQELARRGECRWTPGPGAPPWTVRSVRHRAGCSRWAMCCTRWNRRGPRRARARPRRPRCAATWRARTGRRPQGRLSRPSRPCGGWRRTAWYRVSPRFPGPAFCCVRRRP